MMRFIRPRLRKPVGIALAGTVYAAAWVVHGGNGWLCDRDRGGRDRLCDLHVRAGRARQRRMPWPVPGAMSANSLSPRGRGLWPGRSPCSLRSPA